MSDRTSLSTLVFLKSVWDVLGHFNFHTHFLPWVDRSGDYRHFCGVPDLQGKTFTLSQLHQT